MDQLHLEEMKKSFAALFQQARVLPPNVYLFGHCNASEELAELFMKRGCRVKGILDNNASKQGTAYKSIPIVAPEKVLEEDGKNTLVCIAARAYAAMQEQLRQMGYKGEIRKMVEYDSYAEYSLSQDTIVRMEKRLERGLDMLQQQKEEYAGCYRIYCPFSALGDVYYTMSYLPYFLYNRNVKKYVVFVIGRSCADVVELFDQGHAVALGQQQMDETVQAVLYTRDREAYIPHQDRPYVVSLAKALWGKKISLEMIYKCGVFGLAPNCVPGKPVCLKNYEFLERIKPGKAVILSPYAKSVTRIPQECWGRIIEHYIEREYQLFTNTVGEEKALDGTERIEVRLSELQSVVERAGTFIGIRSGLCDVIREASCRKIALYPNCCYSNTKWRMEEIYHLENFENIIVG